jgi:2Fe-2S ferredoxin
VIIHAVDREGATHALEVQPGAVLMEVLRDEGLGVEAVCGGCCACATCHVYVDLEQVGARGEVEGELLLASDYYDAAASRLSCQITLADEHEGLAVTVAPEG